MTVELVAEPLVGFRAWKVADGYELWPLWRLESRKAWKSGVAEAECLPVRSAAIWGSPAVSTNEPHAEPAPHPDCSCGVHAWFANEPRDFNTVQQNVWGMIVAWGLIEEHEAGFRAQYARIVGLTSVGETYRGVQQVAERYEVPCLSLEDLTDYGRMFGQVGHGSSDAR